MKVKVCKWQEKVFTQIWLPCIFVDEDLWKKYVPQPVQVRTDNIYDYYDILEELGR